MVSATAPRRAPAAPKYDSHRIPTNVALVAPAVRIVIIEAYSDDGRVKHELIPVVAIQASTVAAYSREHDGCAPVCSADPRRLESADWTLEYISVNQDLLIVDADYGLVEADLALDSVNVAWRAVACPWPAGEDEVRLAAVIEEVKAEAVEKERSNKRS